MINFMCTKSGGARSICPDTLECNAVGAYQHRRTRLTVVLLDTMTMAGDNSEVDGENENP